ncbi:MAG TPA: efflux RND transporter periplasmic adaptor subunit [Steroidobacteraceae bacterium]|nr:efflux RND transporter periplasmic adaptor subunit [Steroidobacteraceae bacterium]
MTTLRTTGLALLAIAAALCGGCGAAGQAGGAGQSTEVGIVVVQPQKTAVTTQLPGRTVAFRIAQVRPQVSGIIQRRLFTEGALVEAGQPLYQLDPAPYQAAFDSAQAQVASADANAQTLRLKYERYQKLSASGDVSQQDRDDITASLRQAEAQQTVARAALETARINLGYTRIVAPISGRIATSAFTEGALVTANQDAPLTTVQQYAPMYVDVTQPATEVLRLRQQLAAGVLARAGADGAAVSLLLEDGTPYPQPGRLEFTGITESESTGTITLRAVFPNPDGTLLPGMYVRAVLTLGVAQSALLVPQQAVSRNARGDASVWVVRADDHVELRPLQLEAGNDNQWRVLSGLNAGERVVVQGQQKLRPGDAVRPVLVDTAAPARG